MTKTAQFLAENNIDLEEVLYSTKNRRIVVGNGFCVLDKVSPTDFVAGVAERQAEMGKHLNVKIV